jgi:hypothetical protein
LLARIAGPGAAYVGTLLAPVFPKPEKTGSASIGLPLNAPVSVDGVADGWAHVSFASDAAVELREHLTQKWKSFSAGAASRAVRGQGYVEDRLLSAQVLTREALQAAARRPGNRSGSLLAAWALSPRDPRLGEEVLAAAVAERNADVAVAVARNLSARGIQHLAIEATLFYGCRGEARQARWMTHREYLASGTLDPVCVSNVELPKDLGLCGDAREHRSTVRKFARGLSGISGPRLRLVVRNETLLPEAPPDQAIWLVRIPGPYIEAGGIFVWNRDGTYGDDQSEPVPSLMRVAVPRVPPFGQTTYWVALEWYGPQVLIVLKNAAGEEQANAAADAWTEELKQRTWPYLANTPGDTGPTHREENTSGITFIVEQRKMPQDCGE